MDLNEMLSRLNENIFTFEEGQIPVQLAELFGAIIEQQAIDISDIAILQAYNSIMKASMEAMQNRDFLLLADILEYELQPLFLNVNKN